MRPRRWPPKSHKEASKWFRLAAEQGDADAQFNVGLVYAKGQGTSQDYVLAHMWFSLAGSQGVEEAMMWRNTVEQRMFKQQIKEAAVLWRNIIEIRMTKQQIEEAQRLARNWKPKK